MSYDDLKTKGMERDAAISTKILIHDDAQNYVFNNQYKGVYVRTTGIPAPTGGESIVSRHNHMFRYKNVQVCTFLCSVRKIFINCNSYYINDYIS